MTNELIQRLRRSKRVFNFVSREIGAHLVAINLYPLGVLKGSERFAEKHPVYAPNKRPILLVHGIIHNPSAFIQLRRKMIQIGWKNIFTVNYATRHGQVGKMVDQLSRRVDEILSTTHSDQIDIVAHSLGGLVARYYMAAGEGRGKVRKLITLGSPHKGTFLSPLLRTMTLGSLHRDLRAESSFIRSLNDASLPRETEVVSIYSKFDWTVWPSSNCVADGLPSRSFRNIEVNSVGHMGLLYSPEVLNQVMKNLTC